MIFLCPCECVCACWGGPQLHPNCLRSAPVRLSVMVGIYIQSHQAPDGGRLPACSWTGSYRGVSPHFYRIKCLSFLCLLTLQIIPWYHHTGVKSYSFFLLKLRHKYECGVLKAGSEWWKITWTWSVSRTGGIFGNGSLQQHGRRQRRRSINQQ